MYLIACMCSMCVQFPQKPEKVRTSEEYQMSSLLNPVWNIGLMWCPSSRQEGGISLRACSFRIEEEGCFSYLCHLPQPSDFHQQTLVLNRTVRLRLFQFVYMCVCVLTGAWLCVYMYALVYIHCGGQRSVLGSEESWGTVHLIFETGPHIGSELSKDARLAGQGVLRMAYYHDYRHTHCPNWLFLFYIVGPQTQIFMFVW